MATEVRIVNGGGCEDMYNEDEIKSALMETLKSDETVDLRFEKRQLWMVFSHLQLALRHPGAKGPTSEMVRELAKMIEDILAPSGALRELAEMGWDPKYDE